MMTPNKGRLLGLVCIAVLVTTLSAGLFPFHRPKNQVSWLSGENGVVFGDYGTLYSSGEFPTSTSGDGTLEVWFQPGDPTDWNTMLAFFGASGWPRFSLLQREADLSLGPDFLAGMSAGRRAIVNGVFGGVRPVFLSITSGARGMAVYVDGAPAEAFPERKLRNAFSGTMVFGNAPRGIDTWSGQLRGLAIYDRELSAEQVANHYDAWTKRARPDVSEPGVRSLYRFDEHAGEVVHNAVSGGIDLKIPKRFFIVRQLRLEPFWREYRHAWYYWEDILVNVVGLMPLGAVFFAYWSLVRPLRGAALITALLGFAVSFTIEITQSYLPNRHSGTMDLITNTLGTILGIAICGAGASRFARVFRLTPPLDSTRPEQQPAGSRNSH